MVNTASNPVKFVKFESGSTCTKIHCEPDWTWKPDNPLSGYQLLYAVSGTGEMRLGNIRYPIRKGVCLVLNPGDHPTVIQDIGNRLTLILIEFHVHSEQQNSSFDPPPKYSCMEDAYAVEHMLNRILEVEESEELWKEDEFDCLMKQLFLYLYRLQHKNDQDTSLTARQIRMIRKIMNLIRAQNDSRIDYSELARSAGLSLQYVSGLFKRYTGVSLKEFITRTRLERAVTLLTETNLNVSQVSVELGYSDIYTFSKLFKRYFGVAPSYVQQQTIQPLLSTARN